MVATGAAVPAPVATLERTTPNDNDAVVLTALAVVISTAVSDWKTVSPLVM
jgi:hypothetical protein